MLLSTFSLPSASCPTIVATVYNLASISYKLIMPARTIASVLFRKPHLSASALAVISLAWICTVHNLSLWREINQRLDISSLTGLSYSLTLFSLMLLLLFIPVVLLGQRWLLKPLLVFLLVISGLFAYFTQQLGIVFDVEMMRNVVETVRDGNLEEGAELSSTALLMFLLTSTGPVVVLVIRTRVRYGSLVLDQLQRLGWSVALIAIAAVLVMLNFKQITYFSRENNDLEVFLTPHYPIRSIHRLARQTNKAATQRFTKLGSDAIQRKTSQQRIVGIMVVGETARADKFGLNGYARNTTPELNQHTIVNFSNATSCGTSTAYSVPCMFSFLPANQYSPEAAAKQSNVLDVLESAGVKTVWIDSNSSCKGVCKRIEHINLLQQPRGNKSRLYADGTWQDEILLEYADRYLDNTSSDTLLILHSMGSHGPAYYHRFPQTFAQFTPYCQNKAPQRCSQEEIVNAYDNTIVYTDHVLAALIDKLSVRNDSAFLLYASDHGESLGENGVYLHGLPKFLAPAEQTRIPTLAWFSDSFLHAHPIDIQPHGVYQDNRTITHDNLSASLLGLFDVRTAAYQPALDLFHGEADNPPEQTQTLDSSDQHARLTH
jgi:lipid A ethanolaminephosphotransferase